MSAQLSIYQTRQEGLEDEITILEEQNLSYQESNSILQLQLQILSEGGEVANLSNDEKNTKNILDANDSDLVQTIHQLQKTQCNCISNLKC